MPLTKDELEPVATLFRNASQHYKNIYKLLNKADEDIKFFEGEGHPLSPDQITSLKAQLVSEKALGDAAIAEAGVEIAD